jgi:hypothetical protein
LQLGDGTTSNRQTPVAAVGLGSDIAASIALGTVRLRGIYPVLIFSVVVYAFNILLLCRLTYVDCVCGKELVHPCVGSILILIMLRSGNLALL